MGFCLSNDTLKENDRISSKIVLDARAVEAPDLSCGRDRQRRQYELYDQQGKENESKYFFNSFFYHFVYLSKKI